MIPGVNVEEYITEVMALYQAEGEKPSKHQVAVAVAESLCDQGYIAPTEEELGLAITKIENGLDYYVRPGELRVV